MAEVTLRQIQDTLAARDPGVASLIIELAREGIPHEDAEGKPFREGALTLNHFLLETRTSDFRKKDVEEQKQYRLQQLKAIEAKDAEIPCPDRLKVYDVIESLWKSDDVFSRTTLIDVLKEIPLCYGPWRAIKRIFKEAEEKNDTEIYATIAARVDLEAARPYLSLDGPSSSTLKYMRRRAWRYLKRTGQTFPAIYPDVATDFLAAYNYLSFWELKDTWIAAHILAHEGGKYNRNRFLHVPNNFQKSRAFPDLWRRSPRPLFSLLERANSDVALKFATDALKSDFRASLRDVEAEWVRRLFSVKRDPVDEFAVWILENVPKFEQAAFRDLGLHDGVVGLLESTSSKARKYGSEYARVQARDLPLDKLLVLAKSDNPEVTTLVKELILERDPRKEIGLDAWGELINASDAAEWVREALRKHFGASELTPQWFEQQLQATSNYQATEFLQTHLLKLHPAKKLGVAYFMNLIKKRRRSCNRSRQVCSRTNYQNRPVPSSTRILSNGS